MTRLTAVALPHLPEGNHPDTTVPGLTLRVGARRRSWTYRYRQGDRQGRQTLGYYPGMTLAEARAAARLLAERIDTGAPVAAEKRVHPSSALTVGGLIDKYERTRRREGVRVKALDRMMKAVRRGLADYLTVPVASFRKADLKAARDGLAERGKLVTANRLLAYTSAILGWAAQEDIVEHNFARDIRRAAEQPRERILSAAEVAAVWSACEAFGSFGRMVRFLLLTGARLGEARGLRHGEILDGVWRLPAERNKANKLLVLPLPAQAIALLGDGAARDLCFPGERGGEMGNMDRRLKRLFEASGTSGWTLHDLRRTCATGLQELHVDHFTVEAILNHSLPGVAGTYQRGSMEAAKRDALARWAAEVELAAGVRLGRA